jgi:hypothetical protein
VAHQAEGQVLKAGLTQNKGKSGRFAGGKRERSIKAVEIITEILTYIDLPVS